MNRTARAVMTESPSGLDCSATPGGVACAMRHSNVGGVLITRRGALLGIAADRDLVVRHLAKGDASADGDLVALCSTGVASLRPDAEIEETVRQTERHELRRLPVVENGALGQISSQPPTTDEVSPAAPIRRGDRRFSLARRVHGRQVSGATGFFGPGPGQKGLQ